MKEETTEKKPLIPVGVVMKRKKIENKIDIKYLQTVENKNDKSNPQENSEIKVLVEGKTPSKTNPNNYTPLKPIINGKIFTKTFENINETKEQKIKEEMINIHLVGNQYLSIKPNLNDEVYLERELTCEQDKNAIAIYSSNLKEKIGYLKRKEAEYLAPLVDENNFKIESGKIIQKKENYFIVQLKCKIFKGDVPPIFKIENIHQPNDYIEANKYCKKLSDDGIIVLSLFDGISGARVALDDANIPVKKYYASEIEENCIKVVNERYPDTTFLGDVKNIDEDMLNKIGKIDLLIGGSPCQDLSRGNKERTGLDGDKSRLFYEYSRILKILQKMNPSLVFVLENVWGMPKKSWEIITDVSILYFIF